MDCVKTVAGKQHSAVSYSYKGWRLTKSVSLSDTKGVIIALECTKKRSLHCKYKLTVKGDPDADLAQYVEIGVHNHEQLDTPQTSEERFMHKFQEAMNEKPNNQPEILYEIVEKEKNLLDGEVPHFKVMQRKLKRIEYKELLRKNQLPQAMKRKFPTHIPARNTKLDCSDLKTTVFDAGRAKLRISEIKKRRKQLEEELTLLQMQSVKLNTAIEMQYDDDDDCQVINIVRINNPTDNKKDHLQMARPGRPFPEIGECSICFDANACVVFIGCGKVGTCESCAIQTMLEYSKCPCCNIPAAKDEAGMVFVQIVK